MFTLTSKIIQHLLKSFQTEMDFISSAVLSSEKKISASCQFETRGPSFNNSYFAKQYFLYYVDIIYSVGVNINIIMMTYVLLPLQCWHVDF